MLVNLTLLIGRYPEIMILTNHEGAKIRFRLCMGGDNWSNFYQNLQSHKFGGMICLYA